MGRGISLKSGEGIKALLKPLDLDENEGEN